MAENKPDERFQAMVSNITNVRKDKIAASFNVSLQREGMKVAQYGLDYAAQHNLPTDAYVASINKYTTEFKKQTATYNSLVSKEASLIKDFQSIFNTQQYAVSQMEDKTPVLFFPVRLETTFRQINSSYELWVRIFPDDIAVYTHEQLLTQDEIDQGKAYWVTTVDTTDPVAKVQAWDLLCRSYGAQRAAWVSLQTTPTNLASNPNGASLVFPALTPKSDAWTQQPFTRMLPDAFVINCYTSSNHSSPSFSKQTNNIPDEIKLGYDPSSNNALASFDQQSGEIVTDPAADVDWMIHFDAAIAKGLGVKIPISQAAYNGGFDRIVALGVKTSLTKEASQARLQELFINHHYTDGFSLLKQGTSTNNTDKEYSGYSSVDFGNPVTYAIEREANLFAPVSFNASKTDGQFLCEALGIDFDVLYHIFHSNGFDIRDSMNINHALWQSAMGYYVTNMLTPLVSSKSADQLRDFFTDYVRSRGAIPSIRSGLQPYGILPASVYSRMNWSTDPRAGLYGNLHNITSTLNVKWAEAAVAGGLHGLAGKASRNDSQVILDVLAQSPVSLDRVQRLGFGSGYIWNNLAYSAGEQDGDLPFRWYNQQLDQMNNLEAGTGLPLNPRPRIAGMNFLEQHSSLQNTIIGGEGLDKDEPLPGDMNYLALLPEASWVQLRDNNYEAMGIPEVEYGDNLLFKFSRHSLMLEYFDAACKLLRLPDDQRLDPELVNIINGGSPPQGMQQGEASPPGNAMPLSAGTSRWLIMDRPFENFRTVAEFLDTDQARDRVEAVNLFKAKDSLRALSRNSIRSLELLTTEVMDATAFRLDTWRLALVNQRLNNLRGITDGSSARNMGIYLGSYGWLENIRKRTSRTPAPPPTANFTGPMEYDVPNQGYIHAPSINQAAAAAVLRSGYSTRASSSSDSPLSVNISSERVRSAIDMLEGIRNGQQLPVLLGYEFERHMYEGQTYTTSIIDPYVDELRVAFPLQNTITQYNSSGTATPVQAVNVLDGQRLINAYKTAANNVATLLSTAGITGVPADVRTGIAGSIDWIMNVLDAVGDLTTAEGVFQMVQGNQAKSGAVAEAVSKGNNIPEVDMLDTPKTGTGVNQKFTLHLENNTNRADGWNTTALPATPRALAEPYLNRWIGQLLGDPAAICCTVTSSTTLLAPVTINMAQLQIQPIDLVFIANDELANDSSELASRIRRWIRQNYAVGRGETITIAFQLNPSGPVTVLSFEEILPVLKYTRDLITSCRSLKTTDYIAPTEATAETNIFDLNGIYGRAAAARSTLNTKTATLVTKNNALTAATQTAAMADLKTALFDLSFFGLEQTVYEFYPDITQDDFNALKTAAASVITEAQKRIQQYDILLPAATVVPTTEADAFLDKCQEGLKLLFGRSFVALPLFKLRTQESSLFNTLLQGNFGTLLNDHPTNAYLLDEWVSGIAKVKKNAASYELLSVLASGINLDAFTGDRILVPLQTPYDSMSNKERWLGASVNTPADALMEGRVSFGVSLPAGAPEDYDITGWQVGILVDEWIDVLPNKQETTGIAFQANQPNAKPPQCLLLGLTPRITGYWQWNDMLDMLNETLDLAKVRAVTYEQIAQTPVGHLTPTFMVPVTNQYTTIGFTAADLSLNP
ncbi:hypothetical protein [Taibaiella chishuiensis]|uniref:Uncharacterized protein n=1 Tax=Taibaiella chishuiensis TaxID=1434707 RepID=A0A2P8CT49_9BACT|nr:hypothetical protein [Taibaiella chishuiensis]PSK88144.1 hypothetical protein B0I18_11538 [Taibaiella chishuiensis]